MISMNIFFQTMISQKDIYFENNFFDSLNLKSSGKPGKCPSWSISADEASHKKKKKN